MPGPAPKHSSARARRNRTSTAATLVADPSLQAPSLPRRDAGWHWQTELWWRDIWASPMAPEFHESDRHGLFVLAALVDDYWTAGSPLVRAKLASEIRLQRQCFGLTPMDRRRLQWEIERTDEAQDKGRKRREATEPAKSAPARKDPRRALRAV